MATPTIYFDGATAKQNPGIAGCGVWIPHLQIGFAKNIGMATNNQAEWNAFNIAISKATEYKLNEVTIIGDSQLIINCAQGKWQTQKEHLLDLKTISDTNMAEHSNLMCSPSTRNLIKLEWVRRAYNVEADVLSKLALNQPEGALVFYIYDADTKEFSNEDVAAPSLEEEQVTLALTVAPVVLSLPTLTLEQLNNRIDAQQEQIEKLSKELNRLEQTHNFW